MRCCRLEQGFDGSDCLRQLVRSRIQRHCDGSFDHDSGSGSFKHGDDAEGCLSDIHDNRSGLLRVLAPPDASILLQGYHMLFLLNGDTPSEAKWIRFGALLSRNVYANTLNSLT
jgi:hypothetical protein